MLRLHYYSNSVGLRLPSIEEEDEVYGLEQIKEFEAISQAWKEVLTELLQRGIHASFCVCAHNVVLHDS